MPVKKHLSLVLLGTFSILLGHNMVPHHHHLDDVAHAAALDCPAKHHDHPEEGKAHGKGDKHCHAFNEFSFVKYNASGVPRPVKLISDLLYHFQELVSKPEPIPVSRHIMCWKIPTLDPETKGLHLMRAPPLL